MDNNKLFALMLLGVFIFLAQGGNTNIIIQDSEDTNDVSNLIDGDVSFTGVNKYTPGTSLTGEQVRVFRQNGDRKDLGVISLNSGTLSVTPNTDYLLYFFMNQSGPTVNYYVDKQAHTAKPQDSVDNLVGQGCEIDTSPVVSIRNPTGSTQTSRTGAHTLGASSTAEFEVDIRVHSDKCYGTPGAPKDNVVCFGYDATDITSVKSNTNFVSTPHPIGTLTKNSDQDTLQCYSFAKLEDAEKTTLSILVESNGDPSHNISIFTDDIGFDLNINDLNEIWDYSDESGNQLGRSITAPDGYIYLS